MKKFMLIFGIMLCVCVSLNAAEDWDITSGNEVINSGDIFSNVTVWNDAELSMFGGSITSLGVTDNSLTNIYGGTIDTTGCSGSATLNFYGIDTIRAISLIDSPVVNVYGYGLEFSGTKLVRGYWDEQQNDNFTLYFRNFPGPLLSDNVNLIPVPEPSMLVLMLGAVGLKFKRKQ